MTVKEIIALNHGIDPKNVEEKQTILIPGGKLSARDKEILAGEQEPLKITTSSKWDTSVWAANNHGGLPVGSLGWGSSVYNAQRW